MVMALPSIVINNKPFLVDVKNGLLRNKDNPRDVIILSPLKAENIIREHAKNNVCVRLFS